MPSLELGYTNARHSAAALVATIEHQAPVEELRKILNACVRESIQSSRLMLSVIRKADGPDQWKLVAYALAYHDLPSKEHGEEMVALGMTREEMGRQLDRIREPIKELADSIIDKMANLETAAKQIWGFINRYESESTQVVILAAFLHMLDLTPYVEFSCLQVNDADYRAFNEKYPEFLQEVALILHWPAQKTARMQTIESLIRTLPEKDQVIARGKVLAIVEGPKGAGSLLGQILGQLGGLFGEGGPPSSGGFGLRIDL